MTELWRSQEELDVVVKGLQGSDDVAEVMAPAAGWEMIELEPLGGKGPGGG